MQLTLNAGKRTPEGWPGLYQKASSSKSNRCFLSNPSFWDQRQIPGFLLDAKPPGVTHLSHTSYTSVPAHLGISTMEHHIMWKKLDSPHTAHSLCWFPLKTHFFLSSLYFLSFLKEKLDKEGFSRPISKCWNCFKGSLMEKYQHNSEFLTENLNPMRKASIFSNSHLLIRIVLIFSSAQVLQTYTYAKRVWRKTTKTTSQDFWSSSEVPSLPQVLP